MVDPSPLNLTISHWNQSLRRALQIHLPSCSACSYACKGMIMCFTTTLVRKWSSQIHSNISCPNMALRLYWILPSTMPICSLSEMHALADIIISGWPDDIKEVPHPLCPYWQHYKSLTVEDGLVFHGEGLVIPPSEREEVFGSLYQSHQGITETQLLTCGCVFWPVINKAIEAAVWQCETCMRFQAQNAATPLTPTPTLSHIYADMCIGHFHIGWCEFPHLCRFLLQGNLGTQPLHWPK